MDIIEFVEKVCGCPLLDYQKEFLRRMQDQYKDTTRYGSISPKSYQGDGFRVKVYIEDEVCERDLIQSQCERFRLLSSAEHKSNHIIAAVGKDAKNDIC